MANTTVPVGTVEVPGGTIRYRLRGDGPLLVLHAAPMGAGAFDPMADVLAADRTVLTLDPRGIGDSTVEDRSATITPDQRADDLARLLDHLALGPADILGSSGGAVSALALAQARPDLVRTVVAHEPPLAQLLPDRAELRTATDRMVASFRAGDRVDYWRQFLAVAGIELPPEIFEAFFASPPDAQDAEDERLGVEQMQVATTFWEPDLDALRHGPARVVVGIGEESAGQLCDRASRALCAELAGEPALFPGDHTGFVDHPEDFARRLREALG